MTRQGTRRHVFTAVALLLLSAGWAANHFTSLLGVLREQEHLSGVLVNGAFGIYALGLLPSLLGGGALADRAGARRVVLTGGVIAALGNLSLLFWHSGAGLLSGRFIVGVGVGLVVSAGTAWAGTLRGAGGVTLAGIFLTSGFAVGPIVSGLLAYVLPPGWALPVPFTVSSLLSFTAVGLALLVGDGAAQGNRGSRKMTAPAAQPSENRSVSRALAASLPIALWVFSCVTTGMVILAGRVADRFDNGVLLPGLAAFLVFSAGLGVQMLSRQRGWGPGAGVVGAGLATVGFALAGVVGQTPPLWLFVVGCLVLGLAYGLCLQQGLLDVERLAPRQSHGAVVGVFYVFTYLGFALPVTLEVLPASVGPGLPLLVVAAVAAVCTVVRGVQLTKTDLLQRS